MNCANRKGANVQAAEKSMGVSTKRTETRLLTITDSQGHIRTRECQSHAIKLVKIKKKKINTQQRTGEGETALS